MCDTCSSCAYWGGIQCPMYYGIKSYQWCTMFIPKNEDRFVSGKDLKG